MGGYFHRSECVDINRYILVEFRIAEIDVKFYTFRFHIFQKHILWCMTVKYEMRCNISNKEINLLIIVVGIISVHICFTWDIYQENVIRITSLVLRQSCPASVKQVWKMLVRSTGSLLLTVTAELSGWRPSILGDVVDSPYVTTDLNVGVWLYCATLFANVFHVYLSKKRSLTWFYCDWLK